MPEFVDVAVPLGVRKTFVYSVPDCLQSRVSIGARVLIPFGRKTMTGVIVNALHQPPKGDFQIRAIREVLDLHSVLPASLVETARWAASRYFVPPGEMLRAALPAGTGISGTQRISLASHTKRLLSGGLRPPSLAPQENQILLSLQHLGRANLKQLAKETGLKDIARWVESLAAAGWIQIEELVARPRVSPKEQLGIRALPVTPKDLDGLTEKQRALYSRLMPGGDPAPLRPLLRSAGSTVAIARALERRRIVEIKGMHILRLPPELADSTDARSHNLTVSQQTAFDELKEVLRTDQPRRYLLHGVTGSGKTEIYLRLIGEILKMNQTAILLVPEIALTPLLSRITLSHFPDRIALLHSGMSQGERFDQWNRIRSGSAPVVVGTRSAVFAPLENLRLIILDEEQDPSYKQDESPNYHAREVAWYRMQQNRGLLLLGSATPSVESFYSARSLGEMGYLSLPERIHARPMAEVNVVDMSLEFQHYGKKTVISQLLHQELQERLRRGEQSIVLLNRRGYSRMLLCRSCGHVFTCSECSISMTYHQAEGRLMCHYCAAEEDTPAACINCHGEYIYFVGVGTEQLEEVLRSMFPKARIGRLDRDTTRRRGSLRRILLEFADGRLDILVGTQMLAKGHDFPNVTLVGVVSADAGLSFPDFRSAERTFQLLTQVAGRAGRGEAAGKVVIQSFYPEHYALKFARKQDYIGFFQDEIEYRRLLGYPPYARLIQIVIAETNSAKALALGQKISSTLKTHCRRHGLYGKIRILGPAAAPLEKLRGKYRYQILIKSGPDDDPVQLLRGAYEELGARRVSLKNASIDVDPLSLM